MEEKITPDVTISRQEGAENRRFLLGHVLPFALWLAFILLLQICEQVGWCPRAFYPWSYAVKSLLCAALFLAFRPWKLYPKLKAGEWGIALFAGLLVTFLWIFPETGWLHDHFPRIQEFYYRWFVMMPGSLPDYVDPATFPRPPVGHISWSYSPIECGWGLTISKLIGSAFVIAVIEEFFFRGFLYRWIRKSAFWTLSLEHFDLYAFSLVTLVFGMEHDRWLAGCLAGAIYGWVSLRTGGIWAAAIAHSLTNLVLGVYVIVTEQYGFW